MAARETLRTPLGGVRRCGRRNATRLVVQDRPAAYNVALVLAISVGLPGPTLAGHVPTRIIRVYRRACPAIVRHEGWGHIIALDTT